MTRTLLAATAAGVTLLTAGAAGAATPATGHPAGPPPTLPRLAATSDAHRLGARPQPGHLAARTGLAALRASLAGRSHAAAAVGTLPPAADLSAFDAPVGNQGAVGSCVTWAIDYGMLGWYARSTGHPGAPFAPMYVYSQVHYGGDGGTTPGDAYRVTTTQGVDTQADYVQGNYDWQDQPTPAERANAAANTITGAQFLFSGAGGGSASQTAIETALASGHPVALTIPVYQQFEALHGPGTTLSGVSGPVLGYHEILAVGYTPLGVRIQNSWGTGWGDAGYATLAWSFVTSAVDDASIISGFAPAAASSVSALNPTAGPTAGGTLLTLTGSHLSKVTAVKVGSLSATAVTVVNDSTVTARTPKGSGTAPVTAYVGSVALPVSVSGAGSFSYVAPPRISGLRPAAGPLAGGTTVTLTGTGLTGVTAVLFGTTPATSVVSNPDGSLSVTAPAGSGPAAVTLLAAGGPSPASGAPVYRYWPVPVLSTLAPGSATVRGATLVTLRGAGFAPGLTTVTLGGVAVQLATVGADGTSLVLRTPPHAAGPVDVVITAPGGTLRQAGAFTYTSGSASGH